MSDMYAPFFDDSDLVRPPLKRAAYSDRTAWLMAEMSRLAYHQFEGGRTLAELALELSRADGPDQIKHILEGFITEVAASETSGRQYLIDQLAIANFQLVNVYNAKETQGFLARLEGGDASEAMLVLAFRGTEKKLADIRTDLKGALGPVATNQKAHTGFYEAFGYVKDKIAADLAKDENKDLPLYITGHSLGGALATLATRFLASDSVGACYTFGGPRVGNAALASSIKTPIYRVVNASDGVARVPPEFLPDLLISILKMIPLPTRYLEDMLDRFKGYVHFGDMRFLTHVDAKLGTDGLPYDGLQLISNPSMWARIFWIRQRIIATWGKSVVDDHNMGSYCQKLLAYAKRRQSL